ncbi:helix-turn-helix domain-containing protein [Streptomyces sp. 13-12-16]|uniref:helix-turn-helix domain-containing protein n=1 Tax=Streptomyces sp. 13-12-16 TaxID=1570823 RepID=UPI00117C2484|nr:helix-turn-helix domain-containing protein [Streptomyces sp. 13-12-16]
MTQRSTSRRPFAWTEKKLDEDVLPDRRRFATALQEVCRHLVVTAPDGVTPTRPTQAQAAKYLNVSETTLTRYLQGERIPPEKGAARIYDIACQDAGGGQNVGITRERFLELRKRAEQERCANCSRHRDAVRAAGQKLRTLQETHEQLERSAAERDRELRKLRQHAAVLKQEAQQVKVGQLTSLSEAGPQELPVAAHPATLLPVPRRQGDRQQSKNETLAARHVGRRAEELRHGGRPDSTLALLRHTAEAYTPLEVALLVTLLRTRRLDELADNLVHIYARDRTDQDVVRAALILHEQQAITDAEVLLRIAVAYPGPAFSRADGFGSPR